MQEEMVVCGVNVRNTFPPPFAMYMCVCAVDIIVSGRSGMENIHAIQNILGEVKIDRIYLVR
jgi:hypothetical protein